MKFTFTTVTSTGERLYPMKFSTSPMDGPIEEWTTDITKAITWIAPEKCEIIMSFYGEVEIVKMED